MLIELISFEHKENGLSLYLVPESNLEKKLLEGFWKHGELNVTNGVADRSGRGYAISWRVTTEK